MLVAWIEQYSQLAMEEIRDKVLITLCSSLETAPAKEILRTIAAIGFRSDDVLNVLWNVANRGDTIGSVAVGTLASLGLTGDLASRLVDVVSSKTSHGVVNDLLYASQEIASPSTLDLIISLLPAPDSESAKTLTYPAFALVGFLAKIADSTPNDIVLEDRVWNTIRQYRTAATSSEKMAGSCNTPSTVLDYAKWLVSAQGADSERFRYIDYDRLGELVRPRSLMDGCKYREQQ